MNRVKANADPAPPRRSPSPWHTAEASPYRVDPWALFERQSFEFDGTTYSIGARSATIRRSGAVPVTLTSTAFDGVAARAGEDANGRVTITLELMHRNPHLSIPLLIAHDLDDVAADWREWSRAYGLPMLLIEADGAIDKLDGARDNMSFENGNGGRLRFPVRMRRRFAPLGVSMRLQGRSVV